MTIDNNNNLLTRQRVIDWVDITDLRIWELVLAETGVKVYIGYTWKLPDCTVFQDSIRDGLYSFILKGGEHIKGWKIIIKDILVQSEQVLNIPPGLCY